ncbi:unnamed protein product, partial [Linum tenue]
LAALSFFLPFSPLGLSFPSYSLLHLPFSFPFILSVYLLFSSPDMKETIRKATIRVGIGHTCVFFFGGFFCSKWDSDVFLYGFWFRTRAEEKGVTWWPRVLTAVKGSSSRQVRRGRSG